MKKLFLLAITALSLTVTAQNIHFDSSLGSSYVAINPVRVRYNQPRACRLYLSINSSLNQSVFVNWCLRDSIYIDPTTNNFNMLDNGSFSIPISDNTVSINELLQSLFITACDSSHLNLIIK